jgi:hypothetical protein
MKDRRFHPIAPLLLLADSTSRQRPFAALLVVVVVVVGALLLVLPLAVSSSLQRQFAAALFLRRNEYQKLWRGASKTAGNFGSYSPSCVCAALD